MKLQSSSSSTWITTESTCPWEPRRTAGAVSALSPKLYTNSEPFNGELHAVTLLRQGQAMRTNRLVEVEVPRGCRGYRLESQQQKQICRVGEVAAVDLAAGNLWLGARKSHDAAAGVKFLGAMISATGEKATKINGAHGDGATTRDVETT